METNENGGASGAMMPGIETANMVKRPGLNARAGLINGNRHPVGKRFIARPSSTPLPPCGAATLVGRCASG